GLVKHKKNSSMGNEVFQPNLSRNTKNSVKRLSKEVVKPKGAPVKFNVGKRKRVVEDKEVEADVEGNESEADERKKANESEEAEKIKEDKESEIAEEVVKDVKTKLIKGKKKAVHSKSKKRNKEVEADVEGNESEADESKEDNESEKSKDKESEVAKELVKDVKTNVVKGKGKKGNNKRVVSKAKKRKFVYDSSEEENVYKPKKVYKKKKQVSESSSSYEDEKPLKIKNKRSKKSKNSIFFIVPPTDKKKKESAGKDVFNDKKDGVNAGKDGVDAKKDGVNVVQEGEPDVNEELEDVLEEETFTQWIETNIDWVGEVIDYLYNAYYEEDFFMWPRAVQPISIVCPQTPQQVVTRSSPTKSIVKPPTYLSSPYMNKRTKVTSLIKRLEFVLGNSLFAMQGDKYETVFQTRAGHDLSSVRLNMETLAPGLWIDANVMDCWVAILNHEELVKGCPSTRRHFFPTGCITKAIIEGTIDEEQQWKVFSDEISTQFKHDVSSISLSEVDLSFCSMIEEKISMISAEKIALEDLFKRTNAEFPNDEKVIELCEKYKRLFKKSVFVEDFKSHTNDFDNNDDDGRGKNDDHGFDNVGKKKESAGKHVLNDKKDGVNAGKDGVDAKKDGVNVVQEGEADVNEELEDVLEEETFTQWIETNIDWVGEVINYLYNAYYEVLYYNFLNFL
nr:ulp1 protease family, C-terminal catalytic domain-containing protein [Tanacetum cinerariifolium]